jgi:hypothetical protein
LSLPHDQLNVEEDETGPAADDEVAGLFGGMGPEIVPDPEDPDDVAPPAPTAPLDESPAADEDAATDDANNAPEDVATALMRPVPLLLTPLLASGKSRFPGSNNLSTSRFSRAITALIATDAARAVRKGLKNILNTDQLW